ncbi:30S ribosomal protein S16 [bacterium]|nr:30S ribosomal protein S16 [bacterium]
MLKIRLSRTGRKNYPSYRIVVAEHSAPIKGKFLEVLGHYIPNREPKVFEYDEKKIREWISKGAKPTDTVASLLKRHGVSGMEGFIEARNKKRKSKKAVEEAPAAPVAAAAPAETPAEAPAETPAETPAA